MRKWRQKENRSGNLSFNYYWIRKPFESFIFNKKNKFRDFFMLKIGLAAITRNHLDTFKKFISQKKSSHRIYWDFFFFF